MQFGALILTQFTPGLNQLTAGDGKISPTSDSGMKLAIGPGPANQYRLAQLDDYHGLNRKDFPWLPPIRLKLNARVSNNSLPGTWGFGFWNDPFSISLSIGGSTRKIPVLPNACWYFYASSENYLTFHDHLPGNGFFAGTIRSTQIPTPLFLPAMPFVPMVALPPVARLVRKAASRMIQQSASALLQDATAWHQYQLDWLPDKVKFFVDGNLTHVTPISPATRLGLVIWIDNQFAAFTPDGKIRAGSLASNSTASLEVESLRLEQAGA